MENWKCNLSIIYHYHTYYFHENHLVTAGVSSHKPGVGDGVCQVLHGNLHPGLRHVNQIVGEELVHGVDGQRRHVPRHVLRPKMA